MATVSGIMPPIRMSVVHDIDRYACSMLTTRVSTMAPAVIAWP